MIIVELTGGLGNQMFQYAFGRSLSLMLNRQLLIDDHAFSLAGNPDRTYNLDIFNLDIEFINMEQFNPGETVHHVFEIHENTYDKGLLEALKKLPSDVPVKLMGYWQSYRYFDEIKAVIKADFQYLYPLQERWLTLGNQIKETESVMVHVRRGDYLLAPDFHRTVSEFYLERAINIARNQYSNAVFYIFSDDIGWCKANITAAEDVVFVEDHFQDQHNEYVLQLMSLCKHFIIANSSFSWWAAYLGSAENSLIVAPKEWLSIPLNTADLIPDKWRQISMD
jgi:hypothetical protein